MGKIKDGFLYAIGFWLFNILLTIIVIIVALLLINALGYRIIL